MGGSSSQILYAVPITDKPEHESPVFRHPDFKDALIKSPTAQITTMKDVILNSFKQYPNRNALGRINQDVPEKPFIEHTTYEQLVNDATNLGSAIINEQLYVDSEEGNMKFVGIFCKNRPQWIVVDVACMLYKFTTIPIYDTLGDENITYVLKHTGISTCFVNQLALQALIKTQNLVNLKNLVTFDPIKNQTQQYFTKQGIKIIQYNELLQKGKNNKIDYNKPEYQVTGKDCYTFSYTSGTTGPPKGAMISHESIASFIGAIASNKDVCFCKDDVGISYLPLPHILQRQYLCSMFYYGALIVFYSGDVQKLKFDLALVKPTIFVSVPRLYSRFYDVIKGKFKDVEGFTKTALDHGLSKKLNNVQTNGGFTHKVYDPLFFNKSKQALGGRVRLMISGSAPLLADAHTFLKAVMAAPLIEGYGQTESTGASFVTDAHDPVTRHVGGPVSNAEFKLVDIPQMNYMSTDKDEEGRSTPRGEIYIRGPGLFLGYYKDEQKTKQTVTEDGWLKTGDVGALLPQSRGLKIVDRKKNIFKLQQGQYVAAEKVQNVYLKSEVIAEIFVHGQSTQTFVIAIATPEKKKLQEIAAQLNIEGDFETLCQNNKIRCQVLSQINQLGKKAKLQSFEQAKNIHLDATGFMQKGILTNTMKIQRHEAKKLFKDVIEEMYKQGMLPISKQKK